MKYIDEFRDGELARNISANIAREADPQRTYRLMEFSRESHRHPTRVAHTRRGTKAARHRPRATWLRRGAADAPAGKRRGRSGRSPERLSAMLSRHGCEPRATVQRTEREAAPRARTIPRTSTSQHQAPSYSRPVHGAWTFNEESVKMRQAGRIRLNRGASPDVRNADALGRGDLLGAHRRRRSGHREHPPAARFPLVPLVQVEEELGCSPAQ